MRVLVTRPEPDNAALARELRELGHSAVLQPLMTFHALGLDRSLLDASTAFVLSSVNAIRTLTLHAGLIAEIAGRPLFCVGAETVRIAAEAGFRNIVAVAETAERLVPEIVARHDRGRGPIVHPCGVHRAFDLDGALNGLGIELVTLPIYEMRERDSFDEWLVEHFQRRAVDGIILMSPRTARIFASLCLKAAIAGEASKATYYCLSEAIAVQLAQLAPSHVKIAKIPTRAALLGLLP